MTVVASNRVNYPTILYDRLTAPIAATKRNNIWYTNILRDR